MKIEYMSGFGNCYDTDEREEIERENERYGFSDDDYYNNRNSSDGSRGLYQYHNNISYNQYTNFC